MTNTNTLSIYNLFYIFTKLLYIASHNMLKEYKYSIGVDIIQLSWKCMDLVLEANSLPNYQKKNVILKISLAFDQLKMRIRMMQEVRIITTGQFSHWQENYIFPIGTQIGGWLRWAEKLK